MLGLVTKGENTLVGKSMVERRLEKGPSSTDMQDNVVEVKSWDSREMGLRRSAMSQVLPQLSYERKRDEPVVAEGGKESLNHSRTSNEEAAPGVLFVKTAATQFESRVMTDRLPMLQQYRIDEYLRKIARRRTRLA